MIPLSLDEKSQRTFIAEKLLHELSVIHKRSFSGVADYQCFKGKQLRENIIEDGIIGLGQTYPLMYGDLLRPKQIWFKDYYPVHIACTEICHHHAAMGFNSEAMFNGWNRDSRGKVATSVGINDDGLLVRGYDEGSGWAYHLGVGNKWREMRTCAVELNNWGWLIKHGNRFYSWVIQLPSVGKDLWERYRIPDAQVVELDFKGQRYFEKYFPPQIETLRKWTLLNAMRFGIDLTYHAQDFFGIGYVRGGWQPSPKVVNGQIKFYSHSGIVGTKIDTVPQIEYVEMLQNLLK